MQIYSQRLGLVGILFIIKNIFTLFTADLEYWCKYSKIYVYADDTTSSCKGKNIEEIIRNLKHDANAILSYMASNGLVANAIKTVFMILNMTKTECESELAKEVLIDGARVERSKATKLLGVTIDDKHNWKEHFSSTNGLVNALNRRTFSIRRIKRN